MRRLLDNASAHGQHGGQRYCQQGKNRTVSPNDDPTDFRPSDASCTIYGQKAQHSASERYAGVTAPYALQASTR